MTSATPEQFERLMRRIVITGDGEAVAVDDDGSIYVGYTGGPPLNRWTWRKRSGGALAAKTNTAAQ